MKNMDRNHQSLNASNQIFSILESKFLSDYEDRKDQKPKVSPVMDRRGKICVLSIDGQGMWSIVAGKALAHLENALKEKSGDSNVRIADYIDVAAGTGIGGVFTAMLFGTVNNRVPIFKAEDTWRFLTEQGTRLYNTRSSSTAAATGKGLLKKLFRRGGGGDGGLSNATAAFENAMKETFVVNGQSLTLKNTLKPVLIPCYDLSSSAPFLFSRAAALETDRFDFRLWEVCRATSAEPDLFEPVLIKSVDGKTECIAVDGGFAMSNPTAAAITHVLHNKHEFPFVRGVEDLLVLSLGTVRSLEENYDYNLVKGWKSKDWARRRARISSDSSADVVDDAVALSFGENRCSNYVRIQVYSNTGLDVDSDPTPSNQSGIADEMLNQKNVESVMFGGKRIGEQTNFEKLEWFAGELVAEHRRRKEL